MQYAKVVLQEDGKEKELGNFEFHTEPKKGDMMRFNGNKYFILSREHQFTDTGVKDVSPNKPQKRGIARENEFVVIVTHIKA